MTGCGGGPTASATATPNCAAAGNSATSSGTYLVTVTGNSGSITQSTSFTLVVK
jgi:hypothetical protein